MCQKIEDIYIVECSYSDRITTMQENEINIGQIFRMILMQSKLIILIVFFVGV